MRFGTKVRETYEKVCVKKNLEKVLKYDPQELKTPKKGFHFIISTNYNVLTWQPLEIKYRDNWLQQKKFSLFCIRIRNPMPMLCEAMSNAQFNIQYLI